MLLSNVTPFISNMYIPVSHTYWRLIRKMISVVMNRLGGMGLKTDYLLPIIIHFQWFRDRSFITEKRGGGVLQGDTGGK